MAGYFSFSNRGTDCHWDISDGHQRVFCIRGIRGSLVVRDGRDKQDEPYPKEPIAFRSLTAAMAWIADVMVDRPEPRHD